jgi:heptaprenyl diphosphate synthase
VTGKPDPPTPVAFSDPSLRQRTETALLSAAASGVPWLHTASARLLVRPGKRLRPALVFAAAACGARGDGGNALNCAAAVELLHQSSLIHDDLLDEASERGGTVTVHVTDGQAGAVLAGDYLLAAGGRLISRVGGRAAGVWHEAYADMVEAQARETANRYSITSTDDYLLTVRGKTAALLRASCVLGGLCAGLDDRHLEALATFGEAFGVLFQIVDDLMDVLSTPPLWGKAVQHDVTQGVFTLPVLLAAQAPGSRLPQVLARDPLPAPVDAVYEMVREFGVASAVAITYEWADRARDALQALPPSDARDDLAGIPQRYATAIFASRVADRHKQIVDPYLERTS